MADILNHPAIASMRECGMPFTVAGDEVVVGGFYKSGTATLGMDGERLMASFRSGDDKEIRCFDDLVACNWDWWRKSAWRLDEWGRPNKAWGQHYDRLGLDTEL